MSVESTPGPGAPIRPIILPPSGAELHNNAEQEPRIEANIAGGKISVITRPEFERLTTRDQAEVQGRREESRLSYNKSVITDGGVYIASCAHGGTRQGQPKAAYEDSQVTEIIATTLQGSLTSENLDGASADTARWMATEALVSANQAVDQINSDRGISGQASAGVIKPFRDDQGRNFALLVGVGDVRILSVEPDGSYTTQIGAQTDSSNNPSGTIDGSHSFDRRFNNSNKQDVNERVRIVPIKPGDRFVMVETGLRDDQGYPISSGTIANEAAGQPNPHDAMVGVTRQGIHPEDDINPAELRDIEVVVMDIEQQQMSGLRRIKEAALKPIIGAHALGQSLAAIFRDRRNEKITQARTEYQTNPNRSTRLRYVAFVAAGLALTATGAVIFARLYGAEHAIENTWVDAPDTPSPTSHTPSHGTSPSISESASPTPDDQPTNPGADVDTPAAPGAHPKIDYKLPDGTNTLPNIEHLPKGLTVNGDSAKWLNEHTGAGAIGDYNENATTNDGTGTPGTVWHTALKGLKDLGYDVSQMTRDEKDAYVSYVLKSNGMTWDDAGDLDSGYHIDTPSNYDAIHKVTEITGADGSPLEPKEGSVADQHIHALRQDLQRQIDAANNQNVDSGDKGSDNGAGSAKPTGSAKPSPSATVSPSQHQSQATTVQPSITGTASQNPSVASAYSLENPAMIGYAIAGGTLTAAGVGYGMYSAVSAVRRRRAANSQRVIATIPPAPIQGDPAQEAQIAAAAQQAAQAAVHQNGDPTPIRRAAPEQNPTTTDADDDENQQRQPASGRRRTPIRRAAIARRRSAAATPDGSSQPSQ